MDITIHDGRMLTPEFIKAVNPGEKSDKYSLNMYRWLRCKRNRYSLHVYAMQLHGNVFNPAQTFHLTDVVIGYADDGWIIATTLGTVLTGRPGFTHGGGAYSPAMCAKAVEIPDFWKDYLRHGRCVWDREHLGMMADVDHRYQMISETSRRCLWCGEVQESKVLRNEIIKTDWVPQQ